MVPLYIHNYTFCCGEKCKEPPTLRPWPVIKAVTQTFMTSAMPFLPERKKGRLLVSCLISRVLI